MFFLKIFIFIAVSSSINASVFIKDFTAKEGVGAYGVSPYGINCKSEINQGVVSVVFEDTKSIFNLSDVKAIKSIEERDGVQLMDGVCPTTSEGVCSYRYVKFEKVNNIKKVSIGNITFFNGRGMRGSSYYCDLED